MLTTKRGSSPPLSSAIVTLGQAKTILEHQRRYANRLSDPMFVLSRVLNRFGGGSDVLWQHERKPANPHSQPGSDPVGSDPMRGGVRSANALRVGFSRC